MERSLAACRRQDRLCTELVKITCAFCGEQVFFTAYPDVPFMIRHSGKSCAGYNAKAQELMEMENP